MLRLARLARLWRGIQMGLRRRHGVYTLSGQGTASSGKPTNLSLLRQALPGRAEVAQQRRLDVVARRDLQVLQSVLVVVAVLLGFACGTCTASCRRMRGCSLWTAAGAQCSVIKGTLSSLRRLCMAGV